MSSHTQVPAIKRLQSSDLKQLAAITSQPCVSIIMPTHQAGPETQQGAIRLKNLLSQASQQLQAADHDPALLDSLDSLPDNYDFWQHQNQGLAIFVAEDFCQMYQLPHTVSEHVALGESFLLTPLLRTRNAEGSCFVLTLSWDEAKLFQHDNGSLELHPTESLPATYYDLITPRDPEVSLQHTSHRQFGNTGGTSTAMFHGHGEGEDKIQADRDQYLTLVGDQVAGAVYNTDLPLMVVATKEVIGQLQATTHLYIDATLYSSPSAWSDHERETQISEAIGQQIKADLHDTFERFGSAAAHGQGSSKTSEVLTAAQNGRIDLLILKDDNLSDPKINSAVVAALRSNAKVFRCSAEQMPIDADLAAFYRY